MISDIISGKICFDNARFVDSSYFSALAWSRKPQKGDILFTVTGSYGVPVPVLNDIPFCFQRHIGLIRPCLVNNLFLAYFLASHFVKQQCDDSATGVAQKTVGLEILRNILLPLPPFAEQHRIALAIESAFAVIDEIEWNKADLQSAVVTAKTKILSLAIRGKLVPQDPNDEPAAVLLERINLERETLVKEGKIKRNKDASFIIKGDDNSYYAELPSAWTVCFLEDVGEIASGGTPRTDNSSYWDGDIPWITPADLSGYTDMFISGGSRKITRKGLANSSAKILPQGSVLFSSRAPIGYCVIAANELCTNQGFKSVVPHLTEMNDYIFYYLIACVDEIRSRASGTTFKEISGAEMGRTLFTLPPLSEQRRIVHAIKAAFKELDDMALTIM